AGTVAAESEAAEGVTEFAVDRFAMADQETHREGEASVTIETTDQAEIAKEASVSQQVTAPGPCPDVPAPHRLLSIGAQDPAVREAQRRINLFHSSELAAGRPGLDDC